MSSLKETLNDIDPIMFEPIGNHAYRHTRPNGTAVLFNVETLIDYMLSTGDFTDPETRVPFSDMDLSNIDAFAVQKNIKKRSVLASKNNPKEFENLKFRRDALMGKLVL